MRIQNFLLALTICFSTISYPAHGYFVEKLCANFLTNYLARPVERIRERKKWADSLRRTLSGDPDYRLTADEQEFYNRLPMTTRWSIEAFRKSPRAGLWLQSVIDPHTLVSSLDRWSVVPRVGRAYRLFMVSIFLGGMIQPLINQGQPPTNQLNAFFPLGEDEFEMVYSRTHTYLYVRGHYYDYLGFEARRDAIVNYEFKQTERIRFKATKDEVHDLQELLEKEVGSFGFYFLYPYIGSNCLTHISRAVSKTTSIEVPGLLSRSPTLTRGYFKIRKWLGDTHVSNVYYRPSSEDKPDSNYSVSPSVTFIDSLLATIFLADNIIWAQIDKRENGWTVSYKNKAD